MGQRSQIYVRYNTKEGTKSLIARYFQWNYGTRMVSRARGIIEWCKANAAYFDINGIERLIRIIETNFDYRDVCISSNIADEYKQYAFEGETFSQFVFEGQDNNDGQLYIDLNINWEKRNTPSKRIKVKYAFVPYTEDVPMDAEEYMQWDEKDEAPWRNNKYIQGEVKYTERNIRYINKHAKLMTQDEIIEFRSYDYEEDKKAEKSA